MATTGGNDALQAAFEENRNRLLRFALVRCGDPALAEDLMQDVSIKLATFRSAEPIGDPLAYLFQMLENLVRDARRQENRRQTRETRWEGRAGEAGSSLIDPITPERLALERDLLRKTLSELQELPERTFSILVAFRVDGVNQKQIAAEMGISLSAVEKHLQRAYRVVHDVRQRFDAGEA